MYKPLIGNTERKIKNVKGKNQIKLRKNKQKRKLLQYRIAETLTFIPNFWAYR